MQAGLQLKNCIYSNDSNVKLAYLKRWMAVPPEIRGIIKTNCLKALGTEKGGHSSAAQCIAYIACAELPQQQWTELIDTLVQNVINCNNNSRLCLSSLEAIGYICQDIDPSVLTPCANSLLTAIVHGMKNVAVDQVKLAASTALLNSLEFYSQNFDSQAERDYIMQTICESTQSQNTQIVVSNLESLVKIMSLYYEHMEAYMSPALFPISVEAMKSNVPEISLQGIEFWSSVCDVEQEIKLQISECTEKGVNPDITSKHYAKGALAFIVPILTKVLTQVDGSDEDEWNPPKAASVCLMLLSQLCEDAIVPVLLPFIQENIQNSDWRFRDAAILSFGSMLEGPDAKGLETIVDQAFPYILGVLGDSSTVVKDTAAWTISRICEIFSTVALKEKHLLSLLEKLILGLSEEPRIAVNICWALSNLVEAAYFAALAVERNEGELKTFVLSNFYPEMIKRLVAATDRSDGNQNNLRNAAYSALTDLIRYSPDDTYQEIQNVAVVIIQRIESFLNMEQQVPSSEKAQFNDILSFLCGSLQSILRKIRLSDLLMIADKIAHSICRMLDPSKVHDETSTGVQEDALLAVSAFVDSLGANFHKYLPTFMPLIINCLDRSRDTPVCLNAIGVVGDMSRVLGSHMNEFAAQIITILVRILNDPNVDKSLRPAIIEVFSDFSLAVNTILHNYLDSILKILQEATQAKVDRQDPEMVEYLVSLRKSIIQAYSGILNGISDAKSINLLEIFKLHVDLIVAFIKHINQDTTTDDGLICEVCALIGDLVKVFQESMLPLISDQNIDMLFQRASKSEAQRTQQYSTWAQLEIAKVLKKNQKLPNDLNTTQIRMPVNS